MDTVAIISFAAYGVLIFFLTLYFLSIGVFAIKALIEKIKICLCHREDELII